MSDMINGQPVNWQPLDDWEERAKQIAGKLRRRREGLRFVGVAGDYAQADVYPGSVLQLVAFVHAEEPEYTLGSLEAIDETPVRVDWLSDGYLFEQARVFADEVTAHRLATLRPLLTLDQVVRDVLIALRDDYFSPEERRRRIERLLGGALERLDAYEKSQEGAEVAKAFIWGIGPALCHLVDEPPSTTRLLARFVGAARVRRMPEATAAVREAFALDQHDPSVLLEQGRRLAALAVEGGLDAEQIGGLVVRGERAVDVLNEAGDGAGAVFAALATAARIDGSAVRAQPCFRAGAAYRELAQSIYGRPDVQPLRHVIYEIKTANR